MREAGARAEDVCAALLRRAGLRIVARNWRCRLGEISLDFTVPQWEELQHRAAKRGRTLDQYLQELVDRFMQDVWTRI